MTTADTFYDERVVRGFGKLLQVQTASNTTYIDFVSTFNDTNFNTFIIDLTSVVLANGSYLICRVSANSGSTWDSSENYYWSNAHIYSHYTPPAAYNGSVMLGAGAHRSWFQLSAPSMNPYYVSGYLTVHRDGGQTGARHVLWNLGCMYSSGFTVGYTTLIGSGSHQSFSSISGIRVNASVGNVASGTFRMYGLRKGT